VRDFLEIRIHYWQARMHKLLVEGDGIDQKMGRGFGGRRRPPAGSMGRAPGGDEGGEAPYEDNAFFTNFTVILHFLNSAVR
jgi:hypothetical protein